MFRGNRGNRGNKLPAAILRSLSIYLVLKYLSTKKKKKKKRDPLKPLPLLLPLSR